MIAFKEKFANRFHEMDLLMTTAPWSKIMRRNIIKIMYNVGLYKKIAESKVQYAIEQNPLML